MSKSMLPKFILSCLLSLLVCWPASAAELDDARALAVQILQKLEQGKRRDVWASDVSEWFKQRMTEDAFLANTTVAQAQLGGVSSERKLIQQDQAEGNPTSGYKGIVFSFMFGTTFPVAKAYEQIVLIKEGGAYKLSSINYVPNPN